MDMAQIMKMIKVHSGIPSGIRLLKVKHKKKVNDKIRIVFLCQLPEVWSSIQSIYEAAKEDPAVEPYILAVPEKWEEQEVKDSAGDYLKEQGYAFIRAFDEKVEEFYDLKALQPDYVFLPRPYDAYLPIQYQSETLSGYTKVCYVCYGYTYEGGYILKTVFSKYFTTNCYMIFTENASAMAYCKKILPISARASVRKIIKTPYPRFDLIHQSRGKEGAVWQKPPSEVNKRIIWTPRWSLETKIGATNFFRYRDWIFLFAKKHTDNEILIRPHPLAFDNFVKAGKMTKEDVAQYKETCREIENVQLDPNKDYLDSFASADILVADMSSVIIDFAVMEKPVVFCSPETVVNGANQALIDAFYVVHDQEELEQTVEMLCNNEDPKKEERIRAVHEILGKCDGKNGERILEHIKADYKG